ncbi:MAG: hypothetical protein F7C38_06010 [Desulfurococcales archaeon]|nr:hypothetical protein [Desulfurococcales archaeon]
MATKKVTIEVEVPEGFSEEALERLWRAFTVWLSMRKVRELLSDEELEEIFSRVEERVWKRHAQQSST